MDAAADVRGRRKGSRTLRRDRRERPVHAEVREGRTMMRLAIVALAALVCLPVEAQKSDAKPAAPTEAAAATALKAKGKIRLLGAEVPPGTKKRLTWTSGTAMEGFVVPIPVIVLHGKGP